ncbi:hypothetical protein EYF80_030204 [Liparis tanakae]|uniref:Uncharacterized protein n=1 Tax=Liparis tanakae TaxID=230148 RepID=A0A4Z2H403_9TELE|nr:hypothetical protein EYF80_030204 [Liparis tanakae]
MARGSPDERRLDPIHVRTWIAALRVYFCGCCTLSSQDGCRSVDGVSRSAFTKTRAASSGVAG